MKSHLARLISDYQESVLSAVRLMRRSGIPMPLTSNDWLNVEIPSRGELDGGIQYFKHGIGCQVKLSTGVVDFDFGEDGEIDGFDVWRLTSFAGTRLAEYGFDNEEALNKCFHADIAAGKIIRPGYSLCYLAKVPRSLAIEVDCRLPGDILPHQEQDYVLVLYVHYFLAADLMRKDFEKLKLKQKKNGHLSQNENVKLGVYLGTWLGFLYATCEGFHKLKMHNLLPNERPEEFRDLIVKSNELRRLMNQHPDILRRFRNNVFHLRENTEDIRKFFSSGKDRMLWANNLHDAFTDFFSDYHVHCEVHYVLHNRRAESNFGRRRSKPLKRKV